MTIKELMEITNRSEATVRSWIRKLTDRWPTMTEKTKAARRGKPVDFTFEESYAILQLSKNGKMYCKILTDAAMLQIRDPETVARYDRWFGGKK